MVEHTFVDRDWTQLVESRLRVLTWNVWWRFGSDWRARHVLVERALESTAADIIALQEVWGDEDDGQARSLAESLGYHWLCRPASTLDGIGFGNAILSRWPIRSSTVHRLPSMPSDDGGRDCNLVEAVVEGPRGAVLLLTAHLSWRPEEGFMRQQQVEFILSRVGQAGFESYPPVVCGDFNAIPTSDEIRLMTGEKASERRGMVFRDAWTAAGHVAPGFTWDNTNTNAVAALQPDRRVDYVFVGPPGPAGAGHVVHAELIGTESTDGLFPSDHFGVLAELRY